MNFSRNDLIKATLIRRKNRFVAEVNLRGENREVYVPNTGRLSELALPGAELLLTPINTELSYKILYIVSDSFPVMIDSGYSNRLFEDLIKNGKVPGFEKFRFIRNEPPYGSHRFDFLLEDNEKELHVELKSCTLFYGEIASFPDAVSSRASEHIRLLAETGNGKLVFLILKEGITEFIPNYHTDFHFYETLKKYSREIDVRAFSVKYDSSLKIEYLSEVPVKIPEVKPVGLFFILFQLSGEFRSGDATFRGGFHILYGSSNENIFKTVSDLKKKNELRKLLTIPESVELKMIADYPVVSDNRKDRETEHLAEFYGNPVSYAEFQLFYSKSNPAEERRFHELILRMRFDGN